jgi:hypothetical protein
MDKKEERKAEYDQGTSDVCTEISQCAMNTC